MPVVSKLGRLPPVENGGKGKDSGFLSKEKLLAKVEDGANVSFNRALLTRGVLVLVAVVAIVTAVTVVDVLRIFG